MAAGNCKAAYPTDEWHGYGCDISGGSCMFLYPDSKACAEKYGEGPDVVSIGDCDECIHGYYKGDLLCCKREGEGCQPEYDDSMADPDCGYEY